MKNLDKHYERHILLKYLAVILIVAIFLALNFYFFRWLYAPNNVTAFNYEENATLDGEKISKNIYINIINRVIPLAGMLYEQSYGYSMPSMASAAFSYSTEGKEFDFKNPMTFINIAFPAFGQYSGEIASVSSIGGAPPDVKNFEDAPEGAIYFSEEDEFKAEGEENALPEDIDQIDEEMIADPTLMELSKKDPQILIYHTHATESYMPNTASNYHTSNEKYNVVGIGTNLSKVLQKNYKLRVIHDKTYHDKESYAFSYTNSLKTIKKQMEENKSLKVIIDVHRDAFDVKNEDQRKTSKSVYTAKINGKDAARVMIIVGTQNPNYKELEKFAVYIKKKMDKLYPGLSIGIKKADKKYNLYNSNYAVLLEFGCMLNTDEEAKYSSELMGEVLGQVVTELQQ